MSNIGRQITWTAQHGIITGEKTGRGKKVLFTVKMDNGREIVLSASSFEFTDEVKFAAPDFRPNPRRDAMLARCGGDATLLRR